MGKINITTKLENVTEKKFFSSDCIGIKIDNKIKFLDNDVTVIITINEDDIEIYRKCSEYEIVIPVSLKETKKGIYKIKGLGEIDLDVVSNKLEIKDNAIEIGYSMILDSSNPQIFKYFIYFNE